MPNGPPGHLSIARVGKQRSHRRSSPTSLPATTIPASFRYVQYSCAPLSRPTHLQSPQNAFGVHQLCLEPQKVKSPPPFRLINRRPVCDSLETFRPKQGPHSTIPLDTSRRWKPRGPSPNQDRTRQRLIRRPHLLCLPVFTRDTFHPSVPY